MDAYTAASESQISKALFAFLHSALNYQDLAQIKQIHFTFWLVPNSSAISQSVQVEAGLSSGHSYRAHLRTGSSCSLCPCQPSCSFSPLPVVNERWTPQPLPCWNLIFLRFAWVLASQPCHSSAMPPHKPYKKFSMAFLQPLPDDQAMAFGAGEHTLLLNVSTPLIFLTPY